MEHLEPNDSIIDSLPIITAYLHTVALALKPKTGKLAGGTIAREALGQPFLTCVESTPRARSMNAVPDARIRMPRTPARHMWISVD